MLEKFGFVLDIKNRVVKFGNEELILHSSLEDLNIMKLLQNPDPAKHQGNHNSEFGQGL